MTKTPDPGAANASKYFESAKGQSLGVAVSLVRSRVALETLNT